MMSTPPKHMILSMVSYLQEPKTIILENSVPYMIGPWILTKRKKKSFILVRFLGKPIFRSSWSYWDV